MQNDWRWIWLAGFIDGEGSICFNHSYANNQKIRLPSPSIQITNTNQATLEFIALFLATQGIKIKVHFYHKNPEKHKPVWHLSIRSLNNIKYVIEHTISFLQTKRPQAEIMLKFVVFRLANYKKRLTGIEFSANLMNQMANLNYRGAKLRKVISAKNPRQKYRFVLYIQLWRM